MGVDLKLSLTGSGRCAFAGRLGPPPEATGGGWPIDARVTLSDFTGGTAAPYLASSTGLRLAGGSLDLDGHVEGQGARELSTCRVR